MAHPGGPEGLSPSAAMQPLPVTPVRLRTSPPEASPTLSVDLRESQDWALGGGTPGSQKPFSTGPTAGSRGRRCRRSFQNFTLSLQVGRAGSHRPCLCTQPPFAGCSFAGFSVTEPSHLCRPVLVGAGRGLFMNQPWKWEQFTCPTDSRGSRGPAPGPWPRPCFFGCSAQARKDISCNYSFRTIQRPLSVRNGEPALSAALKLLNIVPSILNEHSLMSWWF